MACRKLASEASPSRPLVVEQNRHSVLALVVQAKQEAATGHTYSADNENIKKKKKGIFLLLLM
jgi:hypothetical protein